MAGALLWVLALPLPAVGGDGVAGGEPPASQELVGAGELGPVGRGDDEIVIIVGDEQLRRSDVFREMDLARPDLGEEVVRTQVLSIMARLYARDHGIDAPANKLDTMLAASIAEQRARFALQAGDAVSLDEYLLMRHGLSPETHEHEMRQRVLSVMLLERSVRYDQLLGGREELQLILVEDEAVARDIREKLDQGASFSVLASRHSVHDSRASGGLLPPVPPDFDVPLLEGRSRVGEGEVLGPAPITMDGTDYWRLLRVVQRDPPRDAPWAQVRDDVERSLLERAVHPDELAFFEERMIDRYRVERPGRAP